MNFQDVPKLYFKDTPSNVRKRNKNKLEDYSMKHVVDSEGNTLTERALAFKKFKSKQDKLRDELQDFDIDIGETQAFLDDKAYRRRIPHEVPREKINMENKGTYIQRDYLSSIVQMESLGNELGAQLLGQTMWETLPRKNRDLFLNELDEGEITATTYHDDEEKRKSMIKRNIKFLKEYKIARANVETTRKYFKNQGINYLKFR